MPKLLIVDDEPNVLYSFRKGLENGDIQVITGETASQALQLVRDEKPDAVILDVRLPDMSGLDAFDQIHAINPHLPVVMVTAHGTTDTAIDAMKRGAMDYLVKPVDIYQLRAAADRALELCRLRNVPALIDGDKSNVDGDRIVGRGPAMQEVYKAIGRVAPGDVTVLILGESGTGKELVARAIYQHSRRSNGPFLAINCAALPEPLLESELFGHERAAFTGADRQRIGKFEQADGGTLFLDELGDMSSATQAKLLRILQDGRFERVGGRDTIEVDVRVVAATNQDLAAKIELGEFRRDLLYRLNDFTIRLPPLRERTEDLLGLVEHFLKLANRALDKQVDKVTPEAWEALQRHRWPGNIRELQSAIRCAVLNAVSDAVTLDCLPAELQQDPDASADVIRGDANELYDVSRFVERLLATGSTDIYRRLIGEVDRVALSAALRHVGGNQVQASERLGVSRTTLRNKMSALGLD